MTAVLKGYLRLCRPPNLPTAAADILAGLAIVGYFDATLSYAPLLLLVLASVFLYAGGVVLNDVFDFKLDKIERPERPIPSGLVPFAKARFFGFLLLFMGVVLAFVVSNASGLVAFLLAVSIVGYDAFSKKDSFLGPLNMGCCRGLNLLLGMSVYADFSYWPYTLVPILFIFAVTLVSRGEVHGQNKKHIILSAVLYVLVILGVMGLHMGYKGQMIWSLPFLLTFAIMVFLPLKKAYTDNSPKNIMKAVKAGVLSIILLDAALAAAHTHWAIALGIILLLPISIVLAKAFAVT